MSGEWQPAVYCNAHPQDDSTEDVWHTGAKIWVQEMLFVHPITLQQFREIGCDAKKFYRASIDGVSASDGAVCEHEILTD